MKKSFVFIFVINCADKMLMFYHIIYIIDEVPAAMAHDSSVRCSADGAWRVLMVLCVTATVATTVTGTSGTIDLPSVVALVIAHTVIMPQLIFVVLVIQATIQYLQSDTGDNFIRNELCVNEKMQKSEISCSRIQCSSNWMNNCASQSLSLHELSRKSNTIYFKPPNNQIELTGIFETKIQEILETLFFMDIHFGKLTKLFKLRHNSIMKRYEVFLTHEKFEQIS